ncbi:MAG: 7-cyano-7-deazaguanine synthase QueC [Bacteroidales bacterium]
MKDSLVVVSGGMDSITMLHEYHHSIALALTFDYKSKHAEKEIACARLHCNSLNIPHIVMELDFFARYFKSDLLQTGGEIPEGHYEDENMKNTVVPFRNGIMLSIAAGVAESNGLKRILIANHFGDHAIYPDCRKSFIEPIKEAINQGTYDQIEVFAPYTEITKREIALIGKKLGIDYATTYSCYKGNKYHCGKCGTCIERKEALSGFDPTEYEK